MIEYAFLFKMVINMLNRLSLYTLLLGCVPLFTWILNWQWQGNEKLSPFDYFLYGLTQTGSMPYAFITCTFFCLIYYISLNNKKQARVVILIMVISLVITQGVKEGLKQIFAEPRPFVTKIMEDMGNSTENFYRLDRSERKQIVRTYYSTRPQVPPWLTSHYINEVNYSFPSGHSIFAASWLMLAVGFSYLFGKNKRIFQILMRFMTIWALLMLVSRLRLGMHYPIDILVSILIAWFFYVVLFSFLIKKAIFRKELE